MMRKTIAILLLAALAFAASAFAADAASVGAAGARDCTDFAGKDIAAIVGATHYLTIEKIGGNPVYYNDSADAAEDVRNGRVDGFMTLLSNARVMASQLAGFEVVPVPAEFYSSQVGGISSDQAVIDRFNAFLAAIKADGTLDEMSERWFGDGLDLDAPMPQIDNSGENGVLRVATSALSLPYVYVGENGDLKGFSAELALRFGAYEGKKIEFAEMEFGALIPYINSGKAELSLASMAITEERKQSVLFTESFHDEHHGILALKPGAPATAGSPLSHADFAGKTIGMKTGSIWDQIIPDGLKGTPAYYSEMSAGVEDVRKGRLDGFITDLSAARVFVATEGSEDLICVEVPEQIFSAPMGAVSLNQDIVDRFNAFLAELVADGTLSEMQTRWLSTIPDLDSPMPDIPLTAQNGTLNVATNAGALPFAYMGANSELKGYSIELVRRFAAREGMDIAFSEMEFGAMIPYVVSGKADLAIADISITEERKKSVLFTDSIYNDHGGIIAKKPAAPSAIPEEVDDYTGLFGKRIGLLTGSFFDTVTEEILSGQPVYYNSDAAGLEDVRNGRIDGYMLDYSSALVMNAQPGNEAFEIVGIPQQVYSGPMGAISADQHTIDRYNDFLREAEADGTLAEMQSRWIEQEPGADPSMPDIPSGENGTIRVVTSGVTLPFSYVGENGELKGYCIELAARFAAREGKRVELTTTDFAGFIPYVVSGKADIGIDGMVITEERKQSVLFSEPHYYDRIGVMVLKQPAAAPADASIDAPADAPKVDAPKVDAPKVDGGAMAWIKTGVERNLITDNRWKMVLDGLGVTMIIAILAQLFGTLFGCFVCWLLSSRIRLVNWIAEFYCGLIHGTPIVVLLMITYYILFGNTEISNVLIAVAAFTMVTGAGVAGNLKGAIDTVDPVEIEAARSIGFSAFKAFRTVTLPQAIKRALPGYTNGFVELVKATAIVGYIAIQDLTRAGDIIRSRTYDAYFPLLFVAVIYLIVTTICVQLFKFIVKKANGRGAAS